jgi:hypothetical protein
MCQELSYNMEIKFKSTKRSSKNYSDVQEHTWILDDQLDIDYVLSQPEFSKFKKAANIIGANNVPGFQISLTPEFKDECFVIYIVVKGGKVLKGGKSKNPLDLRSYSAGTEETWTMRGTCSETNYVWSQIFRESIKENDPIQFYGMIVPSVQFTFESFDSKLETHSVSPYEEEEKKLNALLNKLNNKKLIGEGKLLEIIKK